MKKIMGREWQNARRIYHYPSLPMPNLVDDIPNGMINLENLEIKVSEPFITGLEEQGIENGEAFNEVLTHELTHFMRFPGSVLNILRLQKAGQKLGDEGKISGLRTAFTEAQTNLYMTEELKNASTAKIRRTYGLEEGDHMGKLMYGLYQEISGQDFGVPKDELSDEEKGLVTKLGGIDFLNKNREIPNFRDFIRILKDYQPPQNKQDGRGNQSGQGEGGEGKDSQGSGEGGEPCAGSGNDLKGFSENQIREGLKQFAKECLDPGEYEDVAGQVLGDDLVPLVGGVRRAGTGKGIAELAGNFYTSLSEKFTIPIRKKPMHKNGSLFPHSHTTFEVGDSISDVDAFSTPGILPGITKKWIRKEGTVHDSEEAVPDSFIIMDSSSSMPNPSEVNSIPVLGATAISNAYLFNGSKVGVYNFSGEGNKILYGPSREREGVHRILRTYFNGGTVFDPSALEEMLKKSTEEFDVSVVSDMEISNLGDFMESILSIPRTHRVHLLYTEDNSYVSRLREQFGNKENVAILPLISEKDIHGITMGELKKSVR